MAGGRRIVIEFFGKDKSAGKTADDVGQKMTGLGGKLDKVSKRAGVALVGGLAAASVGLYKMGQAAAEDEQAQIKLAQQLHNSAGASDAQVAATEKWISAQGRALGVADDELRPALGRLVAATHDVGEAQELASLAMDISAGTGKSLESVTQALVKAQNGSVGGLSRLGVATKDASGKTKDLNEITADLAQTYGGQAAKAAETTAGKQKRLQVALGELGEEIGARLLPAMVKATDIGFAMMDWVDRHRKATVALVSVVGVAVAIVASYSVALKIQAAASSVASAAAWAHSTAVAANRSLVMTWIGVKALETGAWIRGTAATVASTAATLAASVAAKTAAAAQWVLNAALTANPIGLVIAAIVGLGIALVVAYKKSETFRNVVNGAFGAVKKAAMTVWNFIKAKWPLLLGILTGPIGLAVILIIRNWNKIKAATSAVWNAIKGAVSKAWQGIRSAASSGFNWLMSTVKSLPGRIKSAAGGLFSSAGKFLIGQFVNGMKNAAGIISGIAGNVWSAVRSLLNGAIDRINAALSFNISLPGPDVSVNPPNIPHLAKGGIVRKRPGGILARIGEGDYDEAVVPLKPGMRGGLGGGVTIVINGGLDSKESIGRTVVQAIKAYERTSGQRVLPA